MTFKNGLGARLNHPPISHEVEIQGPRSRNDPIRILLGGLRMGFCKHPKVLGEPFAFKHHSHNPVIDQREQETLLAGTMLFLEL